MKNSIVKQIDFKNLIGVQIGNAQDENGKTGVTVLYFTQPVKACYDISGGGPASRETPVLEPQRADTPLNAIVLSGGSAFGLAASDGVMECLEENNIGFQTSGGKVPIVVQSDIYDLTYGNPKCRPDKKMGYDACKNALEKNSPLSGNAGAGTGATAGKICGMNRACKTGIGYAAVSLGDLKVGAVVVVNALGDVFYDGKKIAGVMNKDRTDFSDCREEMFELYLKRKNLLAENENTTIGAVITNGDFSKAQLKKISSMTRNAYARGIKPVGTMGDGDSIYAVSCGEKISADINVTGTLAAYAMELAIKDAVVSSKISDKEFLENVSQN